MGLRSQPVAVEALVVGLGNPGRQYEGTPHNVGYAVVERLARRHGYPRAKRAYDGRAAEGRVAGSAVLLLEPTTFMNLSGRSVAAALRATKLTPDRLLVVHDHIDLPFGRLRLAAGGGSGGHNGLKSISGLIGPEYHRLRVGVDRPPSTDPDVVADYVLSPFAEPRAEVEALVERAADAVELWVEVGLEEAANRLNEPPAG
ncbi:MAG TPA: aminoacyl-tRNA hydrolase [Thermoleophilia bacterium]|nr:aminoacyl-tRNA hydrolase [Thermoleophilia bacterium]